MAKEICMDCGKVFDGGAKAFFCDVRVYENDCVVYRYDAE